jgi:cyclopropane fatty-acyl-phospholipid synthase-like methyltransferase
MTNPWINFWKNGQVGVWDTGQVDTNLIRFFPNNAKRILELGCGSGTNAAWMAEQPNTFVTAFDVSEHAIALAKQKSSKVGWRVLDIISEELPKRYDFVYDRGTFHMFLQGGNPKSIVKKISDALIEDGLWLSVIVTERHESFYTVSDAIEAIDTYFSIVSMSTSTTETLEGDRGVVVILGRKRKKNEGPYENV